MTLRPWLDVLLAVRWSRESERMDDPRSVALRDESGPRYRKGPLRGPFFVARTVLGLEVPTGYQPVAATLRLPVMIALPTACAVLSWPDPFVGWHSAGLTLERPDHPTVWGNTP